MIETDNLWRTLNSCMQHCNLVSTAFLDQDQPEGENLENLKECIRIAHICALLCEKTAFIISQGRDIPSYELLRECYTICSRCAEECGKHDVGICRNCKVNCERCAEVCKQNAPLFL